VKLLIPLRFHGHHTDLVAIIETEETDRSAAGARALPIDPADHVESCGCAACEVTRQAARRVETHQ